MGIYPRGVVLHIPHNSLEIPPDVRKQFLLGDDELEAELTCMTDHYTLEIFGGTNASALVVATNFSRLVVDVERFEQDIEESMAAWGMGAVYSSSSTGKRLRRDLSASEREDLLSTYYRPHHEHLTLCVDACLRDVGFALIIDGHSFPSHPFPYELDQEVERPDVCIGIDEFHTPDWVWKIFVECFENVGFSVKVNHPFSGSIVSHKHYLLNSSVISVMVEINRRLYLEEGKRSKRDTFSDVAIRVQSACQQAARFVSDQWNHRGDASEH